jgi:histidinol-phosphate aminotransferase
MASFENLANAWIGAVPVYEPGKPIEEVARDLGFDSAGDIVKLASNENSLGPSPRAMAAMQDAASRMHLYPDGGAFYLKQAIAERLGLSAEHVLPGNGSNELIELLAHVFLGPGSGVVAAEFAFVVYRLIAAGFQSELVSVPMQDLTHDLDAMLAAIRDNTRLVFISNPNNPTGTMVDGSAIDAFMEAVPGNVVVCFDEAYIELLPPESQPDVLKYIRDGRNVVVLRTFSKAYGLAGLRIGYALAPPECIALLNHARQPFNVNAMAQAAALAALADEEHVARTLSCVSEGMAYLEGEFARLGLRYVPAVANFVMVEVGDGRGTFERLQRKGVIVRPMDGYGLPQYIRVTIGTMEENRRFVEALAAVL